MEGVCNYGRVCIYGRSITAPIVVVQRMFMKKMPNIYIFFTDI